MLKGRWFEGKQFLERTLDPFEEMEVLDQAVLDDFRQAGAQFARRERAQRGDVAENANRLMESSNEILSRRMFYGLLTGLCIAAYTMNAETRVLDCASPLSSRRLSACFTDVRYTPSGSVLTS